MFVFAFEGELLAFIVNGDRFVLLALLPRRKPRTDGSVQPPYHSYQRTQPHHRWVLPFPCAVWPMAWISVYCGSGTAAIHKPQTNASGVYFSFSTEGAALAGRAVLVFGRSATASFRRRAIALLCFRRSLRSLSLRYDNRCRSRRPRARTRASRKRSSSTGTGTGWKRSGHGENHEPTSYLHWH